MLIILLILFFLEIAAFIEIGGEIGVFNTLVFIILTAMLGLKQLKYYSVYLSVKHGNNKQEVIDNMFHGICGMFAGVFLIIPGFVTDFIGLLLLIPSVRLFLRGFILNSIIGNFSFGLVDNDDISDLKEHYSKTFDNKHKSKRKKVIDADFEVIDDDK